jgi:hypothetical protein
MLIADGGGGYGGTNWNGMDVVQMWQAVESQDTTAHYQLLTGWQRSYELTLEHLGQVQNYRQSLAEAWPPEKSAASAAYLQRLDALIADLQSTYDAAVANHSAFASATLAISLSRNDVKKIYDEYVANQTKLADFKNQPKPATKALAPPQKPPVAEGRQEQLNNQARVIMFGLSGEIIQARTQIKPPPKYDPASGVNEGSKERNGDTYAAPPIPPVATYEPSGGTSRPSSSGTGTVSSGATTPGTGSDAGTPPTNRPPGLVLGGMTPTPPPTAPITGIAPPAAVGLPGPGSPPSMLPGLTPNTFPPVSGLPIKSGGFGGVAPGVLQAPTTGVRAMPPGGVIGGAPTTVLGQPGSGARPATRVNPVGGVIEPRGASGRPGGSVNGAAAHRQPLGSLGGRSGGGSDETGDSLHWDPDNPWETAEGVSPVVLPAAEQRVDPGPAIGLP